MILKTKTPVYTGVLAAMKHNPQGEGEKKPYNVMLIG